MLPRILYKRAIGGSTRPALACLGVKVWVVGRSVREGSSEGDSAEVGRWEDGAHGIGGTGERVAVV